MYAFSQPQLFTGPARINGKYGSGPNGYTFANANNIKYVDINSFSQPANISTTSATAQYLIGNAPRTAAYGIRSPANQTDNFRYSAVSPSRSSTRRSNSPFEADGSNFLNLMIWGGPSSQAGARGSTTFGEVGAPGTPASRHAVSRTLTF